MTGLELDAIDLEADAMLGIETLLTRQIGVFHRAEGGIGGGEPRIGTGGIHQPDFLDHREAVRIGVHLGRAAGRGCGQLLVDFDHPLSGRNDDVARQNRDRPAVQILLHCEGAQHRGQGLLGDRRRRAEVAVIGMKQRGAVAHGGVREQNRIEDIRFEVRG